MHLTPAYGALQGMVERTAHMEEESYARRLEQLLPRTDDPDQYFSSLLLLRERRMRQLVAQKTRNHEGLLTIDGLDTEARKQGKPAIAYLTLENRFGRGISLLVVIDQPDPELEDTMKVIRDTRDYLMVERVSTFNALAEDQRESRRKKWQRERTLDGFSKDLLYEGGHRLEFTAQHAILMYRRE